MDENKKKRMLRINNILGIIMILFAAVSTVVNVLCIGGKVNNNIGKTVSYIMIAVLVLLGLASVYIRRKNDIKYQDELEGHKEVKLKMNVNKGKNEIRLKFKLTGLIALIVLLIWYVTFNMAGYLN